MRRVVLALSLSIVAGAGMVSASMAPAHADGFALVVPGRMGMTYHGYDAAYAVVEGDFGLNRPGQNPHTVIFPRRYAPAPSEYGYFPRTGHAPRSGRLEIQPPADRKPLKRAASFEQMWTVESDRQPEAEPAPPPAVIVAPETNRRGRPPRRP